MTCLRGAQIWNWTSQSKSPDNKGFFPHLLLVFVAYLMSVKRNRTPHLPSSWMVCGQAKGTVGEVTLPIMPLGTWAHHYTFQLDGSPFTIQTTDRSVHKNCTGYKLTCFCHVMNSLVEADNINSIRYILEHFLFRALLKMCITQYNKLPNDYLAIWLIWSQTEHCILKGSSWIQ